MAVDRSKKKTPAIPPGMVPVTFNLHVGCHACNKFDLHFYRRGLLPREVAYQDDVAINFPDFDPMHRMKVIGIEPNFQIYGTTYNYETGDADIELYSLTLCPHEFDEEALALIVHLLKQHGWEFDPKPKDWCKKWAEHHATVGEDHVPPTFGSPFDDDEDEKEDED